MQPIVQKEFYLAKAAGLYAGEVPDPVSTTDYYYAALCGKYVGELPEPVTAEQKYLANLLGKDVAVPEPITLDDIFMYDAVMRIVEEEPTTRKQYYWRLIAKSRQYVEKTASGNPITLTDSAENKPLGMTLYGWSKQDGTPSPENPVEIESAGGDGKIGVSVRGKNLFHITKESDCDKTYSNETKRIILSGEYVSGLSSNNYNVRNDNFFINFNTNDCSFVYHDNSGYGIGIGINCEKSKTYAFSFETNKGIAYAVFYSEDGTYKTRVLISTYNVFAVPDYAAYVIIVLANNNSAVSGNTIWFKNVQIEETKSITAYEPYRTPQSASLITPNGLPGIPVPSNTAGITYTDANGQALIADEIDLERGKYVQRVRIVSLDSLSWKIIGDLFRSSEISDSKEYDWTKEIANLICSHYVCNMISYNMHYHSDGSDNLIGMYKKSIEIKDTRWNKDVDLFKQSLSGVYAYYVLAIPVERDLTSAELAEYTQLYSYKPTTVVENDSDCWMDVTALCKPE